jgi:hypothetical protein
LEAPGLHSQWRKADRLASADVDHAGDEASFMGQGDSPPQDHSAVMNAQSAPPPAFCLITFGSIVH